MTQIAIINGPNLNMLGLREPHIYGHLKMTDIEAHLSKLAISAGIAVPIFMQSNKEHELTGFIQDCHIGNRGKIDGLIINAGAYSHTSIAVRDALSSLTMPIIEVHLSNLSARENFRHHSFITPIASGCITGMGPLGYSLAMQAIIQLIGN